MDFHVTLSALIGALIVIALGNFVERRRRRNHEPGLLPVLPFQLIGAVVALLAVLHLLTLWRA